MEELVNINAEQYLSNNMSYHAEKNVIKRYYPTHCHEFYEIEMVTDGGGVQIINGESCQLSQGVLTLMTPKDFHSFIPDLIAPIKVYSIKFSESILSNDVKYMIHSCDGNITSMLSQEDYQLLCPLFERFYTLRDDNEEYSGIIVRNLIEYICTFCVSGALACGRGRGGSAGVCTSDKMQLALSYIHAHFRRKLTLDEVASNIYLTPSYLSAYFKQNMGITFVSYVNKLRARFAMDLILKSEMTLTQICYECGFKSFSHFSKVIKEYYGHAPGYFRQEETSETEK